MARARHQTFYIDDTGAPARALVQVQDFDENALQDLVHNYPEILPVAEFDPIYAGAVSVCRELKTPAGPIDNLLITPKGIPVLVECKLWRNPQSRREVVAQTLDYAKELSRWTSADLEREAARRGVSSLAGLFVDHPNFDEAAFHDTLTASLRTGRCLLLILGDGIREGVENIFEHLKQHHMLQFSLGLVECLIYALPGGQRIVVPRIIARSVAQVREVVALPQGFGFANEAGRGKAAAGISSPETQARGDRNQQFWSDFLSELRLDDPEQPLPIASRAPNIAFSMPGPRNAVWICVYRRLTGEVGLFLGFTEGGPGEAIVSRMIEDGYSDLVQELGGAAMATRRGTTFSFEDSRQFSPHEERAAMDWLRGRTNSFISVLRPLIRSAAADEEETGST